MGEAKRRARLDPNYGQSKLEWVLRKSTLSDAHAIFLKIPNDYVLARIVSVHASIEYACQVLGWCNEVAAKMNNQVRYSHYNAQEIMSKFCFNLISEYGDYESDDIEAISTNHGITEIVKGVEKKYIALEMSDETFIVVNNIEFSDQEKKSESAVLTEDGHLMVFSSYITAAYIADYCHNNDIINNCLPVKQVQVLWTEANKLQGKI